MTDFGKLLTASITPFDSNGVINTDTFWRLCRKLVHDKSDGLVLTCLLYTSDAADEP